MRTTKIAIGLLSLFAFAILARPAAAAPTVYDLRQDFSNTNNPNGPWQYLKGNVPLSHFTPVTQAGLAAAAANGYWGDTSSSLNSAIMKTTADGSTVPPWSDNDFTQDQVLVRTTDPNTGPAMTVTWTAPTAGTFTYSGEFWYANTVLVPGGNAFTLQVNNGPILETGTAMIGQDRPLGYAMVNGLTPVNVVPGDILFLEITSLGFPTGSLAGITFTIDFTPVPEPSSLVLVAVGGAGLFYFPRRRVACR